MNDDSILGSALGQLGQAVKQGAKQIVKLPEEMAKDAGGQIGSAKPDTVQNPAKQNEQAASAKSDLASAPLRQSSSEASEPRWKSDEERVKFLRDLYGSAQPSPEASAFANASTDAKAMVDRSADKSAAKPEEQKKLMELRSQLHRENYYDPTFNPVKKQEERPAEKVENEKKQEMQDLQKKEEKKPPPLAAQRAAQRVENLPGAG